MKGSFPSDLPALCLPLFGGHLYAPIADPSLVRPSAWFPARSFPLAAQMLSKTYTRSLAIGPRFHTKPYDRRVLLNENSGLFQVFQSYIFPIHWNISCLIEGISQRAVSVVSTAVGTLLLTLMTPRKEKHSRLQPSAALHVSHLFLLCVTLFNIQCQQRGRPIALLLFSSSPFL